MISSLPDFSAVIFDMDGLVLDTEGTYFIAWQKAAHSMGHDISDGFCLSLSGLQYQVVEQRLQACCGEYFDLQEFGRLSGIFWRDTVTQHGIAVKKGFFQLLSVIQKQQIPYCLATNSRKINAQECLLPGDQ
jgi:beta-phosphoglucomutase-like phosphatase (HAD superfamily)